MSTNVFDTNVTGNIHTNPAELATSTDFTLSPTVAEIQLNT